MTQIPFDTLAYSKELIDAGMEKQLAEAQAKLQARVLRDLTKEKLATKADIGNVKQEIETLRQEFKLLRQEFKSLRQEFKTFGQVIRQENKSLKQEMTIRMGSITCTGLIVLVALMKLLHL